jgi:uncharacterized membrane protein
MMQGSLAEPLSAPDYCVTSRRNDSLGSKGRWRIFAALCCVSFALALAFAAFGAWPVLPYSGLEMGVLFWAFRWLERHAADWERVSVHGDRVIVERQRAGVLTRREFNRCWTQLESQPVGSGRAMRLALRYAGERVPFGDELPLAERESVLRELRRALAKR